MRPAGLDPTRDFERYRQPATTAFCSIARARGLHYFYDLDDAAEESYAQFWADWIARGRDDLEGSRVAYIAAAMVNKLCRRARDDGRSGIRQTMRDAGGDLGEMIVGREPDHLDFVIQREELWTLAEAAQSLPPRERTAFGAVLQRDSKRKGAPPAGYKLAATKLGVSVGRAKKLSLAANRGMRTALKQIESGAWCQRWSRSIELVLAGGKGEPGFRQHAERCASCRMAIVSRRKA